MDMFYWKRSDRRYCWNVIIKNADGASRFCECYSEEDAARTSKALNIMSITDASLSEAGMVLASMAARELQKEQK